MTATVSARHNPFATARLHALPFRLPGFDWLRFEERLAACAGRGAIVGDHGSGKTQFLEELGERLRRQGQAVKTLRLHACERRLNQQLCRDFLPTLLPADAVLLDGAEQLGNWAWWQFVRRTRPCRIIVITTHRPCRWPTLLETTATTTLLDELLSELIGETNEHWRTIAHAAFQRHRGNIRDVWRELYDICAAGGAVSSPPQSHATCLDRERPL